MHGFLAFAIIFVVMKMTIRKACAQDIDAITKVYDHIHEYEDAGKLTTGWITGVYPVRSTAEAALERDDLYVCEADGEILAAAIINKIQVDVYANCDWKYKASDDKVCVLHTLVVDPAVSGKGIGSAFVKFYEDCAREQGCTVLRMDTNARNTAARGFYEKLGFIESGIEPCVFNGIPDVMLVLLEKEVGGKTDA